jgi:hypothetical protein
MTADGVEFQLPFDNLSDLDSVVARTYVDLRALISADTGSSRSTAVGLDDHQTFLSNVSKLSELGCRLYDTVFLATGPDRAKIRAILRDIEQAPRPVDGAYSIALSSSKLYYPWQLLYPCDNDPPDSNKFWGIKYALAALPLQPQLPQGSLPATSPAPSASSLLFGRYVSANASDQNDKMVEDDSSDLENKLHASLNMDLIDAYSKAQFLYKLESRAPDIAMLWTYTHASSGLQVTGMINGIPFTGVDTLGPRIEFGNNLLTPDDLAELRRRKTYQGDGVLLAARPIVILVGCETGTSAKGLLRENDSFAGALLELGARAVVVTESQVRSDFGLYISEELATKLRTGLSLPMALREVRLERLQKYDTSGLVYTYYGGINAKLSAGALGS